MARFVSRPMACRNGGRRAALFFFLTVALAATRAADFSPRAAFAHLGLESNGVVVAGQFAPGTDWQTVNFPAPVKGRYFWLEALSSQDGRPFAAVAELEILDAAGKVLSREGWRSVFADSEEEEREKEGGSHRTATCWERAGRDPGTTRAWPGPVMSASRMARE